jgi:DNA primase
MIDQNTIDKIYEASQIVEVVQDFVSLKKRGVNLLGLCPFHNEKTPSFTVSPSKGIYKCFGCGKGGNVVNFVMEHENLGYYDALHYLARKFHIDIVEHELSPEEIAQKNERESLLIITDFADKYFQDILYNTTEGKTIGLAYFIERGIREEMIKKFQLGYSLEKRDAFTETAIKKGYKKDYLIKTGLTVEKEEFYFDRFAGRVIFPIHDVAGKIIGFGGRILKSDKNAAKYLNSPESDIYHKSKVLYGMFFAKKSVVQNDKCYLVEGYTDVISMHQCGIENVVASSGTALTEEQIRLIKRFTNNLTIVYDGDSAGIKAALRGIDMVLEQGLNVKVLLLPEGEDPDSFSKKHSASEVLDFIIKNESDLVLFKTRLLMDEAKNDPVKRATLISDIVKSVAIIPDAITRSVYIKECASLLHTEEGVLYSEIGRIRRGRFEQKYQVQLPEPIAEKKQIPYASTSKLVEGEIQEYELVRLLLNYGNNILESSPGDGIKEIKIITVAQFIISEIEHDELEFQHPLYKQFFDEYAYFINNSKDIDEKYFTHHPDKEVSALAADLLSRKHVLSNKLFAKSAHVYIETEEMKLQEIVPATVMDFKSKKVLTALRNLQVQLLNAQQNFDIETMEDIQFRIQNLSAIKKTFAKSLGNRTIIQ